MIPGLLIIDDEPSVGRSLTRVFSDRGYRVSVAHTAAAGLAHAQGDRPQVVLLDHNLPDADGLDVLRSLLDLDPRVRVIVITAFGDEAPTRPGLVALAMERWARARGEDVSPDEVLVVGDTPRDVDCARANGCACLAVATGHYSAEQLRDAGATVVVDHLDDPSPFWDLVAR